MAPEKPPSRVVFVGNIPYGLTEEQIIQIFSQAGHVNNFRLVYDHATGRPKGFGFAEYQDVDSAASAVRNLNDYETMGRKLRVDFSNDSGEDGGGGGGGGGNAQQPNEGTMASSSHVTNGHPAPTPQQAPQSSAQPSNSNLPPLPPGVDLPPGVSCPDAISRTLATLPPTQLLDVISQMKGLATADPSRAVELLTSAPQLSYAIFQALLLMGLVETSALQSVIEQNAAGLAALAGQGPPGATAAPAAGTPLPPPPPPPPPPSTQPSFPQFPEFTQFQAPAPGSQPPGFPPPIPPPAMQQQPPPAPVPPPVAAPTPAPAAGGAPPPPPGLDKAALFQYVLSLTNEQLNAMRPAERDQIMAVRQQIISGQLRA